MFPLQGRLARPAPPCGMPWTAQVQPSTPGLASLPSDGARTLAACKEGRDAMGWGLSQMAAPPRLPPADSAYCGKVNKR